MPVTGKVNPSWSITKSVACTLFRVTKVSLGTQKGTRRLECLDNEEAVFFMQNPTKAVEQIP